MAIVILEEKNFEGKKRKVKVYKSKKGRLVTAEEKKKADDFNQFLSNKITQIESELKKRELLQLKGKRGKVLELWYGVGKRLHFVNDNSIVSPDDREFVWRAIYDHTKLLNPGPLSERVKRDPSSSHFAYCYYLSQFPWGFVSMAGDWTSWSEFFDRRETKNDSRIIDWLGSKVNESNIKNRQNWLRPLTRAIHNALKNIETGVFDKKELYAKLDNIFNKMNTDE